MQNALDPPMARKPPATFSLTLMLDGVVWSWGQCIREGSRVALQLNGTIKHAHRPHPGKEARKYQIEEIRQWLEAQGVHP